MKKTVTIKRALSLVAALLFAGVAMAQLPMTRSSFTGTYTAISTGTGATASTAAGDDGVQGSIPIGFSFNYLGTPYTAVAVSTNGWLSFNATTTSTSFNNTDMYSTTGPQNALFPWFDDMTHAVNSVAGAPSILYQLQGAPGSQTFTVQWTNVCAYRTAGGSALNFQVILYEGTNVIEFRYGTRTVGTYLTGQSASIGIEGLTGGPGNYMDAMTGNSRTGHFYLSESQWPNYYFRFTPGAPAVLAGGTYNVGVGQTYGNLTEAVCDIQQRGISGAVTLNLVDAVYDTSAAGGYNFFPILIGPVTGSSSTNTITISKSSTPAAIRWGGNITGSLGGGMINGASASINASNVEPIFALCGADFVTLNNVDIRGNVGFQNADHAIGVYNSTATDGSQNNTFSNFTVIMRRANTGSRGVVSNVTTTPTAATGANSNNIYRDFSITNVYAGVQLLGNATFPDLAAQVVRTTCGTFNTIGDPATANDIGNAATATFGIQMSNQSGFIVAGNSIRNVTNTGGQADGINILLFQGNSVVANNRVRGIRNAGTASTTGIAGIRMSHATTGTHAIAVFNNTVSEITSGYTGAASTARTLKGIFVAGTGGAVTQTYQIYNNSVSIDGSSSLNVSSSCFEVNTTSGPIYTVANNIFANFTAAQGATSKHFTFVSTSATLIGNTGSISNNNDLYVANDAGVSGFIGQGAATTYTALADWQLAMTQDAASVSADPLFASNTADLHPAEASLNGAAMAPPVFITVDNDCATRTPDNDIGAYILNTCSGTPTAGTISGVAAVCSGAGTTLTLTGMSTGLGISYQWASSTTNGGPYTTLLGTSASQATGNLTTTTYYVVTVTCSASGLSSTTAQFTLTVNPLPSVAVTPTTGSICLPGGSPIALTASGATTYTWLPTAGLTPSTGANVSASPTVTTTYTVTGADAIGCTSTATSAITVGYIPNVASVTATPASVCANGNSQLQANASGSAPVSIYSFAAGTGSTLDPMTGATTVLTTGNDDTPSGVQTIGFTFTYNGTNYTQYSVSPDGWILMGGAAAVADFSNQVTDPTNIPKIYPYWDDVATGTTGNVQSVVTGTAPNRILKIQWFVTVPRATAGPANATFQCWMYEGTNVIEFRYGAMNAAAMSSSVGLTGGTTNFNCVTIATNTNSVSVTNDLNAGQPPVGTIYTFTPPTPTYSWSPATFLSSTTIANPMANSITATTTYTVTVSQGTCSTTSTVTVSTGGALTAAATATPTAVCVGSNLTLNATPTGGGGPYTYSWTGPNSFTSTSQNPTITAVTLAAAGTYSVTINDACSAVANATVAVTVNPLPTVAVTPSTGLICLPGGSPVALTASGASTYTWLPTTALTPSTGANVSANPTTTTTYTVTGTDGNGCVSTATAAITVSAAVVMDSVIASPATLCNGNNSTLTAYPHIVVGAYCQPTTSCTFPDIITNVTFGAINRTSVCDAPTGGYSFFATPNPTITAGVPTPLSVSTGGDVEGAAVWIDYNQNGTFEHPAEMVLNGFAGTNPATYAASITVPLTALNGQTRMRVRCTYNQNPTALVSPPCTNVTFGETEDYTISIVGATPASLTYVWTPNTFLSSTTTNPTTATAVTASTTYTVTTSTAAGCTASGSVSISTPTALAGTATAVDSVLCAGDSAQLMANSTGGLAPFTYAWSGPNSFSSTTQNPTITGLTTAATGTYTCTITDACSTVITVNVPLTVNALPVVALSGNNTICAGDSTLLTGSSGGTSQWYMNGVAISGATSNTYYASVAGVYNMTKTNLNGCMDSSATGITVVVNALPTVTAAASATTVCAGDSVTYTGTGASTYIWNNGVTDAVPFATTVSGYYTVTGTDVNGCTDMDSVMVTVNALPVVNLGNDSAQCEGTILLDAANAGASFMWQDNSTAQTFTVSASGTYYVQVTDGNGCMSSDTMIAAINANPVVALGPDSAQCGGSVMLDAGNIGSTYLWNDSTATQTLAATTTGTYYVTVTDVNGCMGMDTVMVTINNLPVVALGNDTIVCGGSPVVLDAGNAGSTYMWQDNSTAQTLTATSSGTYYVTVTDPSGCAASDTIVVNNGGFTLSLGADTTQCGGSVTLDAGNPGLTYLWSDNSNAQTLTVSASGTFAVTVTDSAGCVEMDTVIVTINALPTINFSIAPTTICQDDASLTLTATPAGGTFAGPGVTGNSFDPSALTGSQTITYTYTDSLGCDGVGTDAIVVDPCVSVNGIDLMNGSVTLYPNPNVGQFTISLGYVPTNAVTVEIINSLGQMVQTFTMTTTSKEVDLGMYEGGIYMVRVIDGGNVSTARVVKQ
jgi:hypothetical protein